MPFTPRLRIVSVALLPVLAPTIGRTATFQTLVTFDVRALGSDPQDLSITSQGSIFGTTEGGGRRDGHGEAGGGVFAFNPDSSGKLVRSLHTFYGMPDGQEPDGAVTQMPGGRLFGATFSGGNNYGGVIYSVDPRTKTEAVVYSFDAKPSAADGAYPIGQLVRGHDGKLYGTTYGGGPAGCGCGTVFRLDPKTGALKTIHGFYRAEGYTPYGITLNPAGTLLYGVTFGGGKSDRGTIYSLDPVTKAFTVLYDFPGGTGGAHPLAPPVFDAQGNAYGGTRNGTVYMLTAGSNAFVALAQLPSSAGIGSELTISPFGTLYGTSFSGGPSSAGSVFSVVPSTGVVTILHRFDGLDGGGGPSGLVLSAQGVLYGTTIRGENGGTIYKIEP